MPDHDILTLDDVRLMVDTFYGSVRQDPLLGPIFDGVIQDRWPSHLGKMYQFWQGLLLGEHTYEGRPFPPHAVLPIEKEHFERWLTLFHGTVDELFEGPKAEEAKWRSLRIAETFHYRIQSLREGGVKPLD